MPTIACTVLILGEFFLTTLGGSAFAASEFSALDEGGAPEHFPLASSTIPREAIEGFLFLISDRVKDEVLALDGNIIQELPVPILFDVLPEDLEDSWGVPRPGGRVHEGIDILAERGASVVSPTDAVVTNRGFDPSGGIYCITANPGGEQFYYAHLESIRDTIVPGIHLKAGDILGSVGNTGNAEDREPHLHFGIYYRGSAIYPNPRLTHTFSLQQKADILERTLETGAVGLATAVSFVERYAALLEDSPSEELTVPPRMTLLMNRADVRATIQALQHDLTLDARGTGVRFLQEFLIRAAGGPTAEDLAHAGATGYFGPLTRAALREYQERTNITPARGYFGPRTRTVLLAELLSTAQTTRAISRGSGIVSTP